MFPATRIKLGAARGTGSRPLQILLQGHFMPAHTAQDRFFMQMAGRPADDRMILRFLMTKIAWIVLPAAGKLNRYDIQLRMVMDTTGHIIHDFAFDNHFFHMIHFLTEKGARCQRLFLSDYKWQAFKPRFCK
jgi:hypothetical protein